MFAARFDNSTRFDDEARLRARFGGGRISLAPGASLMLTGTVTIGGEVAFEGACTLGDGTSIGNGSQLTDVVLGPRNRVRPYSILVAVTAGADNLFGPFCFIRDGCAIGDGCILGAHVEAARSQFGSGVKVSHRAFIGDATVSDETIIGAGVVFCNWDGADRQATRVGAKVTIGSGSLLVPPLVIGDAAVLAAGSTVLRDVPAGARIIQKRA